METFEKAQPHLRRNRQYNVTAESHAKDFDKVTSFCAELEIPVELFLKACYTPRLSEQLTKQRIRPKHLYTDWALAKLRDYLKTTDHTPRGMEIEWIKNTKIPDGYFDGLVPDCLGDLRNRKVSLIHLVGRPEWKPMIKRLPPDLIQEFFYGVDVVYIEQHVRIDKQLMEAINGA